MSYRVNGNVIIDDGGNVTLTNFPPVGTPTNVSPAEGETDLELADIVLTLSNYEGFYQGTIPLKFAQFQVSNASSFASGNIVYDSGNAAPLSSNTIPISLEQLTTFYWRGRYINNNNVYTNFSNATSFTTKDLPTVFGQSIGGGFYSGTIDIGGGTCYYLIVAPNATGCASCQWKTTNTATPGSTSLCDGYANTYPAHENAEHPAGNWTATRTINGFSDWYFPSINELSALLANRTSMPVGETWYLGGQWSSTENSATAACFQNFGNGAISTNSKTNTIRMRAIRRIPI